jgi:hypothetical protein
MMMMMMIICESFGVVEGIKCKLALASRSS